MKWRVIPEFPGYSVSDQGLVRNDDCDRILTPTPNQHNVVQVGLMQGGVQYKRGVALLVAKAFLPDPIADSFNTPINLNGDRFVNHADNLKWRPRWFAIKYHRQFFVQERQGFGEPIVDVESGEEFPTSWEAAITYGLLDREIFIATVNRTYVWPTYQRFRVLH